MTSALISHADKVLFAERGDTKGDLAAHYERVAEPLMRTMGGRGLQPVWGVLRNPLLEERRAPAALRSSRSGFRRTPQTGCRPRPCPPRTEQPRRHWLPRISITSCG